MDVACLHCGYDFPVKRTIRRAGFTYSAFADFALMMGVIASGLGCIIVGLASVAAVMRGVWLTGLIAGPLMFFFLLAAMIVLLRVQDPWSER